METKLLLFAAMLFAHIVDDYYLQGVLAQLKQRKWWETNAPEPLYKHDYTIALVMHAFSWSFVISLPALLMRGHDAILMVLLMLPLNTLIHAWVDNEKANEYSINLITDQLIHIGQVVATWLIVML